MKTVQRDMRIIAVVPMKLNNRRLPQKNTRAFSNGKPLCHYILKTLCQIEDIEKVYVYCSDLAIQEYIPDEVVLLKRDKSFDTDATSMTDILKAFAKEIPADIYVMTHTTAPFIQKHSIIRAIDKVASGDYDSAFAARRLQDFLWKDGRPINYNPDNIPRTQDLPIIYVETSGFYVYNQDVIKKGRRIGDKPYIEEVSEIESVDIDEPEDFFIADAIHNHLLLNNISYNSHSNKAMNLNGEGYSYEHKCIGLHTKGRRILQ